MSNDVLAVFCVQQEAGTDIPGAVSAPEAPDAECEDSDDHAPPHVHRLREASALERRLVGDETGTPQGALHPR